MKKYYIAYSPCTEDLRNHPVDHWVQVSETEHPGDLCLCGDLHLVDVEFRYFPLPDTHPCLNKTNAGYAFGYVSYINTNCELELNPKPIPNNTLYRMRWQMFGDQYRFCVQEKTGEYLEMDHVDHLILFRGIPFVSGPKYKTKLIEL